MRKQQPSSTANDCLHFFAVSDQGKQAAIKLQKTLSAAAAQKVSAALLDTASPTAAARFFACTASYASAWLSDPFLARPMRDEAHGAACKLRLNQPISSIATCYCGESLELTRGTFLVTRAEAKLVVGMMKLLTGLSTPFSEQVGKPGLNLVKISGRTADALIYLRSLAQKATTLTSVLRTLRLFPMSKLLAKVLY